MLNFKTRMVSNDILLIPNTIFHYKNWFKKTKICNIEIEKNGRKLF